MKPLIIFAAMVAAFLTVFGASAWLLLQVFAPYLRGVSGAFEGLQDLTTVIFIIAVIHYFWTRIVFPNPKD